MRKIALIRSIWKSLQADKFCPEFCCTRQAAVVTPVPTVHSKMKPDKKMYPKRDDAWFF